MNQPDPGDVEDVFTILVGGIDASRVALLGIRWSGSSGTSVPFGSDPLRRSLPPSRAPTIGWGLLAGDGCVWWFLRIIPADRRWGIQTRTTQFGCLLNRPLLAMCSSNYSNRVVLAIS